MGKVVHRFATLPSTNQYATDLLAKSTPAEGTVILADAQSAGKGQFGSSWESVAGKNLLFSLILYPRFLRPPDQFLLAQMAALALAGSVESLAPARVRVKWPNDIYIDDRKVAGILIQNQIGPGRIHHSIVGMGLNVNQTEFPRHLPNPTSLARATGGAVDRRGLFATLMAVLEHRYLQLQGGQFDRLRTDYHRWLYGLDEAKTFHLPDGHSFEGSIRGVDPTGKLRVEGKPGGENLYRPKEISYR